MWMSGLNRASLPPEALRTSVATIPFEITLIEAGADWKYLLGFDQENIGTTFNQTTNLMIKVFHDLIEGPLIEISLGT